MAPGDDGAPPAAGDPTGAAIDEVADDAALAEAVENREALLAEAAELATADAGRAAGSSPDEMADLVRLYWRLVPDEELVGRTGAELYETTCRHRKLAQRRGSGQPQVELRNPDDSGHTVLSVVTDDMAFLVDSVTAALVAHDLEIHLVVHPQVVVRRDAAGELVEVLPRLEADQAGPDDTVESWMTFEVDRQQDEAALGTLSSDIERVLTDVREVSEDWPDMVDRARQLAAGLQAAQLPVPDKDIEDAVELLQWLADDHFTFLGYREYQLAQRDDEQLLAPVDGSGLGILRGAPTKPRSLSSMAPEAEAKALEKRLLTITKANSRATVHRNAYLDYIGIKTFDGAGNVVGEKRFLGLFTSAAYVQSTRELPVVRRKVSTVLRRSGLSPRSHSGRDLMEILETYPRDELFQISTDELYRTVMGVLRLAGRRQLRLFVRRDAYGRFISCLVFLPRDRFSTRNRLRIQRILMDRLNGVGLDYSTRVTEGQLARIHVTVRTDPADPPGELDVEAIQHELADATRLWEDDFRLVLQAKLGDEQSRYLYERYASALPQTYQDEHTPYEASKDLAKLELLDEPGELAMHLYRRRKNDDDLRFKVFRLGEPMMLSALLPVLHSLGVRVADERPYEICRADGTIYLYDFGLRPPADALDMSQVRAKVENAFSAAWRGESEVDGLNQLVLRAGLTWRQIVILRLYVKYLRQAGTVFSQDYIQDTIVAYPGIATLLVALFETRFDPRIQLSDSARAEHGQHLIEAITAQLDDVASLEADRILRNLLTLIESTLRTSFFQRGTGRPKPYVAVKLDAQRVPVLPKPRPRFEIFVYSPRFEGVHLRFGAVARGGLRWSDRREDFRTEILGLVKAQMVKNAVIVPVGAKGGFVLKQAPAASDREAFQAEGVACYKMFISALLDVTDNIEPDGTVVHPTDVVRHDGDDTYLVVAADKGTATFSDIANQIAIDYGYWLGDAFASGGSVGYDHKKMGITARGAWESVKYHFRELGTDCQTEPFTAVGVGDMSGDVFGNGMLCSETTRLIAAFDHRHIFLDPDPDPAASYAERRRMFDLPRSSWADYDASTISAGGGVWSRAAKSIPISGPARAALGLADDVTSLSPPELMRAILLAPVDLLWNGGIGTYVKARTENNVDVGDKANDAIRVDGGELRCKIVGEGGNLGCTQLGRVEFAAAGGRINTDFIDNSAGVDTSDHEVNIKVLLNRAKAAGELTEDERRALLFQMTDEIGEHVLLDNYDQNTALGCARAQAYPLLPVHRRLITDLERSGRLDRVLEGLPTDEELAARDKQNLGLYSPEFCVILAYVKIALEDELLDSTLPDEPWTAQTLVDYFPTALRERYADQMAEHPLHREIVTTLLVNETVNRGGISFVFRAMEETGASEVEVLRAFVITRDVFGLAPLWRELEALDNTVPAAAQVDALLRTRRALDRAVRWILQNRRSPLAVPDEIERFGSGMAELLPKVGSLYRGAEQEAYAKHRDELAAEGVPAELADRATRVLWGFGLLDVVEVAHATGRPLAEIADVYYAMSERFRVDELLDKISNLPRHDRWQTQARQALRYDLYAALAALTAEALAATDSSLPATERVDAWAEQNATPIGRALAAIGEFHGTSSDLAALSVLLRQIRTVVRTSALAAN
ncbi:NAD-glutamate dehydrogenase [Actinocatenispora thailandica]|uniref:NAD-glutamate dehydrogenase n=1 Tax=Actinocatenispora thailandica TaxID=227318 RepID=A0A7R7HX13_9ACTN|nr:NAD-glutamate dehydrogenase [Actinocatenispora thailandica]BCJ34594.1 NAD-glutamate dehydrogenase [Actinocatenispora thailandica]